MRIYLMAKRGTGKEAAALFLLNFSFAITLKILFHVKHVIPVDVSHPAIIRT